MVGAATHTLPSSFTANCATLSGRDAMVQAITNAGSLPLRAYGECLNNMPPSERGATKVATLRKYQFCVTIENSVAVDYVSEKVGGGGWSGEGG